jgi:hypothetical protein
MCCRSEKIWQLQIAKSMSKDTSVYSTNVQIVFLLITISYKALTDSQTCIMSDLPIGNLTAPTKEQHFYVHFSLHEIEFERVYPLSIKQNSQWQSLLFIELVVVLL